MAQRWAWVQDNLEELEDKVEGEAEYKKAYDKLIKHITRLENKGKKP